MYCQTLIHACSSIFQKYTPEFVVMLAICLNLLLNRNTEYIWTCLCRVNCHIMTGMRFSFVVLNWPVSVHDSILYLHMSNRPKDDPLVKAPLLCCRKLASEVLITYLQALVSVAQAQLPAGHHGLPGAPGLSTDQTPALRPVRVWAQHLQTALVTGPSSCDSDLCGANVLGTREQSIDTQEPGWIKSLLVSVMV